MDKTADQIAALYDWRHSNGGTVREYMPIAQADIKLLARHVDLPSARVCDVGCGNGTHLRALLEAGVQFPVGIDLSGRALSDLLNSDGTDRLVLLCGDVTLWRLRDAFGAVVCSLPPLAVTGRMGLRAFIGHLHLLLHRGGLLLLKLFTRENIPAIVGNYAVQYEGASVVCNSYVSQSGDGDTIRIVQHIEGSPSDTRTEELAVPTIKNVLAALNNSGFLLEQMADDKIARLPGTETFIARAQ